MKRLMSLVVASMFLVPAAAEAATWEIDPSHSNVQFKVRHFFTKVGGEFNTFSGTIEFDPKKPENLSVAVTIDPASVDTNNEKRDWHLRSEDFFWVEEHPEMTFTSTKATQKDGKLWVEGMLNMRGVEKPVTLEAEFLGAGPDAWGGTRAGFTATGKLNRKDFGINWNKTLDTGAMLGDEVEIILEIEAIQKAAAEGE